MLVIYLQLNRYLKGFKLLKDVLVRFTWTICVGKFVDYILLTIWYVGSAAFAYGEFLVASQNFSSAKEVYQRVIEVGSEVQDLSEQCALAGGNMSPMEVLVAATCALGQLEGHLG